jgi:intein/homing endonuclease
MSDFSEKDVSDISVGDKVIGWKKRESGHSQLVESKVLNTFKRKADIQKTVMENGDVLYHTPDHKWANGSKIKNGGDGPFWVEAKAERERENTWRASQLAKVYRSEKEDYFENEDYMKGYLFGAFRGDGWLSRTRHIKESPWREKKSKGDYYEHSCGIATQDREIIQRCFDYLNNLSITSNTMSQRSDGLWKIECSNKSHWNFFQNEALKRNKDKHWYAGFLAGIYDTEATGLVIAQCSEYNKSTYNLIQNALDFFEFNYNSYKEKITVTGGRTALFKLWKISNPALQRKLKRYVLNAGGRFVSSKQKVKSTEIVEKNVNVYTIKTETGNYVAYGYCSRNCDAKQTRWGLDYDGASNIKELHERLKKLCYIRRNKKEVLEDLPDKQRSYIEFDVDNRKEYNMAEEDLAAHLRKQEITDEDFLEKIENLDAFEQQEKIRKEYGANEVSGYAEKLMKLAELRKLASKGKLKKAKKWIKDFLKSGEKLVLFAHHKFVIQELVDEFNALKIDGSVPVEDRQDVVDKFQNDDSEKVIVLNIQAGGTGLTLTESSNVVFLELPWTPAEVSQAEDRCVLEGQPVLTTNGWTSIEDVNVGEHVIGHDGKPHKVTDKWSRKAKGAYSSDSKDIVEIDLLGWQNPIKVTSDHRILTENGWIEASDISPRDKILMPKQYDSPDKEAIKVSEECRLDETYKIPEQNLFGDYYETKRVKPESVQKNGNLIKLPDSLELSKDALFTFGYYIGDGHCYTGNKKGRYVSFAAHQNQKDSHLKTCRNWIESLGINSRTRNDDNSMGCEMRSYSGELAMWFENNFGRKLDQKKIPEWVYECSKKQREWFIEGWLAADGYKKRNRKEIITAKKHLAAEASRLLMSIGYKPCVNYGKDSGSYSVGWTEKVEPKLTVKSVYQRTCNKKERVYDITVKDVNSFVVGTSVVHNCHRIGQEDSVNVYFLLAKETIDKDMFEVLKKKRIVTEQINAGKDITDEEGNVVKGVIKKITDRQS